jgi:hypothetical protein
MEDDYLDLFDPLIRVPALRTYSEPRRHHDDPLNGIEVTRKAGPYHHAASSLAKYPHRGHATGTGTQLIGAGRLPGRAATTSRMPRRSGQSGVDMGEPAMSSVRTSARSIRVEHRVRHRVDQRRSARPGPPAESR